MPEATVAPRRRAKASVPTRRERRTKGAKRTWRPSVRIALVLVVFVGLLFAFVYPTRTWLDQRSETNQARQQLSVLQAENARLARETKRLSTDSEIERLAREKYGLVRPGERAFVIVPAPTTAAPAPTTAPTSSAPPAP